MKSLGSIIPFIFFIILSAVFFAACEVPTSSLEVKTTRSLVAGACAENGKCIADPQGLVVYNPELITENRVLRRPADESVFNSLLNLVDEPKLLLPSKIMEPLLRGVALVGEFEPCDSPKGITGSNPTAGQLRLLKEGRFKACIVYIGEGFLKKTFAMDPIEVDTVAPMVTSFGRASGQTATKNSLAANFTITFSEAINASTFEVSDISNAGTAIGVAWTVTDSGDHINFEVSAIISSEGTIQPTLAASAVNDPAGNSSAASINTATNFVSYRNLPLTVTVNQASSQVGPTNNQAISFTVVFSSAVGSSSFDATDITQNGTATGITWSLATTDSITYTLSTTVIDGQGTVVPSIAANKVVDTFGNSNTASTSTDNSVTLDTTVPTLVISGPSATTANSSTTITYTITYEGADAISLARSHITLNKTGTADANETAVIVISGTGTTTRTVTLSSLTGNGTVGISIAASTASDLAGNLSAAVGPSGVFTLDNIPGTPTGVVGTSGNSQISLSWTAPATNGGSAITNYMVQYSSNGGTTWTTFNDANAIPTATSATVTGLANGTAYRLRVAAVNAVGMGTYSSNSASVTPVGSPGTPTGVVGTSGNSQISLTWTAPSNGGSAIKDYIVQYSSDSGTNWTTFNDAISTATSATVTGLANGTAYIFCVAAENALGIGSNSSNSVSVTSGTARAPTAVSGTSGNAQISLNWTAPATNGGSAITDYIVQYSSDGGTNWTTFNDGTSTTASATVMGLSNGTTYIFRVAAVNGWGTGSYSSNSASVTSGLPGAPTSVVGTSGNAQVSLSWTAPANDGGNVITDYIVQHSINGTTWTTFNEGTSANTSATVTGLTTATPYFFRVAAVNAAGIGSYSSTSASVTIVVAPGAPTSVTGTAGHEAIEITWNAPTFTGGAAIIDYSIQYSSNGGLTWTTVSDGVSANTNFTIIELTNGTDYIFTVAASHGVNCGVDNPSGQGAYSGTSSVITPSLNSDQYIGAQTLAIGSERPGPDGATISLQFANGSNGFKIWKEKDGSRILNASGIINNGWQKQLIPSGTSFTGSNFTNGAHIGGRACPPNVFLSHKNMTASGRCLYFDPGNATQALTKDTGIDATDYINNWTSAITGRGALSSFYEGNVKTCNLKAMRLPTIYEASINNPAGGGIQLPTGDVITPVWAGSSKGVPSLSTWTWTASANPWTGHYAAYRIYHMWKGASGGCDYWGCMDPAISDSLRCVLPGSTPWEDVTVSTNVTLLDTRTGLWWSNDRGQMDWDTATSHCTSLNYNGQVGWRLPTEVELLQAFNNGIRFQGRASWITSFAPFFWSSTIQNIDYAWYVNLENGSETWTGKVQGDVQVVCVR